MTQAVNFNYPSLEEPDPGEDAGEESPVQVNGDSGRMDDKGVEPKDLEASSITSQEKAKKGSSVQSGFRTKPIPQVRCISVACCRPLVEFTPFQMRVIGMEKELICAYLVQQILYPCDYYIFSSLIVQKSQLSKNLMVPGPQTP